MALGRLGSAPDCRKFRGSPLENPGIARGRRPMGAAPPNRQVATVQSPTQQRSPAKTAPSTTAVRGTQLGQTLRKHAPCRTRLVTTGGHNV